MFYKYCARTINNIFAVCCFPGKYLNRDFSMAFLGLDRRHHLYLQSSVLSDLWHRGLGDFIANNKAKDKKIQSAIIIFFTQNILITSTEITKISGKHFSKYDLRHKFSCCPLRLNIFNIWPVPASSNWSRAEWQHLKMFGCCHSLWIRGQITNSGQGMRLPDHWSEARKFLWFHSESREHIPRLNWQSSRN